MLRTTRIVRQSVDLLSLAQRVGPSARGEIVQLRKQVIFIPLFFHSFSDICGSA